jgi:uncharacterized protein (TIGR00255 family)
MLKSMTGYGKATCNFQNKTIRIELKSVNSKQSDINCRIPLIYKEKEMELRNEISKHAERGKIDCIIAIEQDSPEKSVKINKALLRDYYDQITEVASELSLPVSEQTLLAALRLPEIFKSEVPEIADEEWNTLLNCLKEALNEFDKFRAQEGKALEKDIDQRLELILKRLEEVSQFESGRIDRIRERLKKNLNEFIPAGSIEANRFEQEVIYFLEKLDITEEKVRLRNHCEYFSKTMVNEVSPGRKLAFISQEMGREINTIGSKANDVEIQKRVVMMKDELEKIKEQLLNVL